MWEMIERMATDRLWIYTALAGSAFGAIFVAYMSSTRIGLWFYSKIDQWVDYLVERWGWTWLQQPEDAWRQRYPKITKKIDELEERIKKLESIDTVGTYQRVVDNRSLCRYNNGRNTTVLGSYHKPCSDCNAFG